MKICSRCNERPAAYTKNLICKECQQAANRKYYEQKGNEVKVVVAKYRAENRDLVNAAVSRCNKQKYEELRDLARAKLGDKCACCGECSHWKFLTIDHVNNDGNVHRKEIGAWPRKIFEEILAGENEGRYQLLCWNCNMGKARNGGVCPHVAP